MSVWDLSELICATKNRESKLPTVSRRNKSQESRESLTKLLGDYRFGLCPSFQAPPWASYAARVAGAMPKQPHSQRNPTSLSSRKLRASARMCPFVSLATETRSSLSDVGAVSVILTPPGNFKTDSLEPSRPEPDVRLRLGVERVFASARQPHSLSASDYVSVVDVALGAVSLDDPRHTPVVGTRVSLSADQSAFPSPVENPTRRHGRFFSAAQFRQTLLVTDCY